jgi:hypothetical protein
VSSQPTPASGTKTLYFSRDTVQQASQPAPPIQPPPIQVTPAPQPAPAPQVTNPALRALGTVQVSPAYTGPVTMPTTTPPQAGNPGAQGAPMSVRQRKLAEEGQEYSIQLDFPSMSKYTRLESEAALKERMRNEFRKTGERITFPDEPVLTQEAYQGRHWPPMVEHVEPHYLCYGRLFFEQPNSERFGWSVGVLQPLVSALHFYTDVFLLPYHLGTRPCDPFECSAGRCLPGDPVPLLWYPPQLSVTGLAAQTGAVAAGFFIFP